MKPQRKPSHFRTKGQVDEKPLLIRVEKEDYPVFNNNWLISVKLGRRLREKPPDVRKLPTSLVSLNGIF